METLKLVFNFLPDLFDLSDSTVNKLNAASQVIENDKNIINQLEEEEEEKSRPWYKKIL